MGVTVADSDAVESVTAEAENEFTDGRARLEAAPVRNWDSNGAWKAVPCESGALESILTMYVLFPARLEEGV